MKKRKIIAAFLALCLLAALLSACGGVKEEQDSSATAQTEEQPAKAEKAEEQKNDEAAPQPKQEQESEPEYTPGNLQLPLTENGETLSIWFAGTNWTSGYDFEYSECYGLNYVSELTGVNLDVTFTTSTNVSEQYTVMFASGEYPDIITSATQYYASGGSGAVSDGVIIDLAPYLDSLLINYKAALMRDDDFWYKAVTSDGYVPDALYLENPGEGINSGMMVAESVLDAYNLELPETIDDYDNYLRCFKEMTGFGGWLMCQTGDDFSHAISGAFGASSYTETNSTTHPFLIKDGAVVFGPTEDGYRDALKVLSGWWADGLINPDCITMAVPDWIRALSAGESSCFNGPYSFISMVSTVSGGSVNLVPTHLPVLEKGQMRHDGDDEQISYKGFSVSTACAEDEAKLELALKFIDFGYTEQGSFIYSYGVEGKTFEYVDGEPKFLDIIVNNEEVTTIGALWVHVGVDVPTIVDGTRYYYNFTDTERGAFEMWGSDPCDGAYKLPTLTYTTEQNEILANTMADIRTYVLERVLEFIMGNRDINDDAEWNEYVSTVESMGIQDCIDITTDSYNSLEEAVQRVKNA